MASYLSSLVSSANIACLEDMRRSNLHMVESIAIRMAYWCAPKAGRMDLHGQLHDVGECVADRAVRCLSINAEDALRAALIELQGTI